MYTGEPSPEIDNAWHQLLWGRYFSISEEEAKALWGDSYEEFRDREKSGFTGGQVFSPNAYFVCNLVDGKLTRTCKIALTCFISSIAWYGTFLASPLNSKDRGLIILESNSTSTPQRLLPRASNSRTCTSRFVSKTPFQTNSK